MTPDHDPVYRRLVEDVERAYRAYVNAAKDRKRVRDRLAVKRSPVLQVLDQYNRRPVGSPKGFRIPREPAAPPPPPPKPRKERRVYMGKILGWVTITAWPSPPEPGPEDLGLDLDKLYDETSRRLYWNAKEAYEKAMAALQDYSHRGRAREAADHAAALQWLGADDAAAMEEIKAAVEAGCVRTWQLYQGSPSPKSPAIVAVLMESIADAQFVGLESPTTASMEGELQHLLSTGALRGRR